jgi:hypothetical protein
MNTLKQCIARVLIVSVISLGMSPSSMAGIVATNEVHADVKRDQVRSFLDRAEVRAALQELGVDPAAARDRVDALSDDELASLAGQLDQAPAGASDVLTAVVVVFLVLIITDLLGITSIFPFTRSMRK